MIRNEKKTTPNNQIRIIQGKRESRLSGRMNGRCCGVEVSIADGIRVSTESDNGCGSGCAMKTGRSSPFFFSDVEKLIIAIVAGGKTSISNIAAQAMA